MGARVKKKPATKIPPRVAAMKQGKISKQIERDREHVGAGALHAIMKRAAAHVSLRQLAAEICAAEGLKVQLSIAQVSEILGVLGRRWRTNPAALLDVLAIMDRAGKRR